ncbi:putative 3-methyladenine DNA glycosylase [Marmoricola endophyticus]|uniref:Putative 3-methyladenine DNA glycosylase n=1 Tax=Marmoricola endophyticus TaxID=2040280 RepID=A0A917BBF7_9ACTN|nr:DNA-3-methyladenine glycosylase [Marmoricola endophyticus]GGF35437.1 putative 3-methyladenine DNA glycosylase [Marmoricola endophyticus]
MAELDEVVLGRVEEVAPLLLGAHLTYAGVTVRLTEVEAYAGPPGQYGDDDPGDPGAHSYRGPTKRNRTMLGPPGRCYTYFTYGMHWCANVVTGPAGTASAVLLRAGEVVEGHDLARERREAARRSDRPLVDRELARGPACLCRALAIGRDQDGLDLTAHLELAGPVPADRISTGPRVGLRLAADRPWRFWLTDDPTVSRYVRAPSR